MITFWLWVVVVTLVASLIAFYPLWFGKKHTKTTSNIQRDDLNKAFYLSRLHELKAEEDQGILDDPAQSQRELQQNLLQDIPENEQRTVIEVEDKAQSKIWAMVGFLLLLIAAGLAYMDVGSWQKQAALENASTQLPHFYERLKEEDKAPLSKEELEAFTLALRVDLQHNPQQAMNWWRLGELAVRESKVHLALQSYARAYELKPKNNVFALSYARILMFSDNNMDKAQGQEIVRQVLRRDHTNLRALGLLAFQYFADKDYRMAAATWAMMLRILPPNDPMTAVVQRSFVTAQDLLKAQEAGDKADKAKEAAAQNANKAEKP